MDPGAQDSAIADGLAEISETALPERFSPAEMENVYPDDMWSGNDDERKEYLLENYRALATFITDARNNGLGACILYT